MVNENEEFAAKKHDGKVPDSAEIDRFFEKIGEMLANTEKLKGMFCFVCGDGDINYTGDGAITPEHAISAALTVLKIVDINPTMFAMFLLQSAVTGADTAWANGCERNGIN